MAANKVMIRPKITPATAFGNQRAQAKPASAKQAPAARITHSGALAPASAEGIRPAPTAMMPPPTTSSRTPSQGGAGVLLVVMAPSFQSGKYSLAVLRGRQVAGWPIVRIWHLVQPIEPAAHFLNELKARP
jgi:hypothetical protein